MLKEVIDMENETKEEFKKLVNDILLRLKEELEDIDNFPYDFNSNVLHDTIHEEVDTFVSGFTRKDSIRYIDFCDNEEYIDKGVVDNINLDRTLITTAFECIRQKLFDEESLFYDLQEYKLTKKQRDMFIKKIDEMTWGYKHAVKPDNDRQLTDFKPFTIDKSMCDDGKIINLHSGIKVFSIQSDRSKPNTINDNALVYEGKEINDKKVEVRRVYVMGESKIDLREYKEEILNHDIEFLMSW